MRLPISFSIIALALLLTACSQQQPVEKWWYSAEWGTGSNQELDK